MIYTKIEQDIDNSDELNIFEYEIIIDKIKLLELFQENDLINNDILGYINSIMHGDYDKLIDIFYKKRKGINLTEEEIKLSLCSKVFIKRKIPLYCISGARNLMDYEKKIKKSLVLSR